MIKLQIELPSEVEEIIKNQGHDVESYVNIVLVKPLLDQLKNKVVAEVVENNDTLIKDTVSFVKDSIKVGKQVFRNFEITDKDGTQTLELEVDSSGEPLMKFPKNTKVIKLD